MKDEEKFRRNRELELKHGRICVLVAPESDFCMVRKSLRNDYGYRQYRPTNSWSCWCKNIKGVGFVAQRSAFQLLGDQYILYSYTLIPSS